MILLIIGVILILLGVGYYFSPFDVFPDFIPVIGRLDDILISLPLIGVGLWLLLVHGLREIQKIDTDKLVIVFLILVVIVFVAFKLNDNAKRDKGKR